MAVNQYPRGESIVDREGRPTPRFLQYIEDATQTINQTETTTESIESAPTSTSRLDSVIAELAKRVEELEWRQFPAKQDKSDIEELSNIVHSRPNINHPALAELTKRVEQLEALI